jgi:hypothetical protein
MLGLVTGSLLRPERRGRTMGCGPRSERGGRVERIDPTKIQHVLRQCVTAELFLFHLSPAGAERDHVLILLLTPNLESLSPVLRIFAAFTVLNISIAMASGSRSRCRSRLRAPDRSARQGNEGPAGEMPLETLSGPPVTDPPGFGRSVAPSSQGTFAAPSGSAYRDQIPVPS